MLILISSNSARLDWVNRAIANSRSPNDNRRVVPVIIEPLEKADLVSDVQYIDISTPELYDAGIERIVHVLTNSILQDTSIALSHTDIDSLAKEVAKEIEQIIRTNPSGQRQPAISNNSCDQKLLFSSCRSNRTWSQFLTAFKLQLLIMDFGRRE